MSGFAERDTVETSKLANEISSMTPITSKQDHRRSRKVEIELQQRDPHA